MLALLLGSHCSREPGAAARAPNAAAADTPAPVRGRDPEATGSRGPAKPARIVAIGDLHGDVKATRAVLQLAGVLDEHGWSGGDTVVVQTGDQLDRGDDEPDILALLRQLQAQARSAGGDLVVLNGNHELMNVGGDFRYVTADGFADYAAQADNTQPGAEPASRASGRAHAFAPGGAIAREFALRPVAEVVGSSLFVHGGVLAKHLDYGLERINREVGQWLAGARPAPPPIVAAEDSPVWTRRYSEGTPSPASCAELEQVLARAGVKRMVVGHTVQATGINSVCGEHVWRIDVGLSRLYGGPIQALEIRGDGVRVLRQP